MVVLLFYRFSLFWDNITLKTKDFLVKESKVYLVLEGTFQNKRPVLEKKLQKISKIGTLFKKRFQNEHHDLGVFPCNLYMEVPPPGIQETRVLQEHQRHKPCATDNVPLLSLFYELFADFILVVRCFLYSW